MNKALQLWDTFLTLIIQLPCNSFSLKIITRKLPPRVSVKDKIIFFKRLSMMLRAQMPIITSLTMIQNEHGKGSLAKITTAVILDISSGQTLANALSHYKNVFGYFSLSIIAVGERSGTLPESLEYIAVELKKKHELRKQITGALIYPAIVILATLAISIFLIVFIFPKIVPIFLSVKTALPWSTKFLMTLSEFLSVYGWYVISGIVLTSIFLPFLLKIKSINYYYTLAIMHTPIIGPLCKFYNLAQISRTLGLLLSNEIPLIVSVDITSNSLQNCMYKESFHTIRTEIMTGKSFGEELKKYNFLFPSLFVQMVHAGEKTGSLPVTLTYVSEIYESDIKDMTKNLTTIIEPILMLFMGLMVGFIAISIITPIYGITQNIHQ